MDVFVILSLFYVTNSAKGRMNEIYYRASQLAPVDHHAADIEAILH